MVSGASRSMPSVSGAEGFCQTIRDCFNASDLGRHKEVSHDDAGQELQCLEDKGIGWHKVGHLIGKWLLSGNVRFV